MANTLSLRVEAQNIMRGGVTLPKVTHKVPAFATSEAGYDSLATAFTTASLHTIEINSTNIDLDGAPWEHPITHAEVEYDTINGFCITAERAATATAPTGTPTVVVDGFAGWSTAGTMTMKEDGVLCYHNPSAAATSSGDFITVQLTGTTGWRINVLVWYTP